MSAGTRDPIAGTVAVRYMKLHRIRPTAKYLPQPAHNNFKSYVCMVPGQV